jgi:hypothetical protein
VSPGCCAATAASRRRRRRERRQRPMDLPAETLRVEPLGPVHVLDAEEDRAHVRFHALSPLAVDGDAHDGHATCGSVTGHGAATSVSAMASIESVTLDAGRPHSQQSLLHRRSSRPASHGQRLHGRSRRRRHAAEAGREVVPGYGGVAQAPHGTIRQVSTSAKKMPARPPGR